MTGYDDGRWKQRDEHRSAVMDHTAQTMIHNAFEPGDGHGRGPVFVPIVSPLVFLIDFTSVVLLKTSALRVLRVF